MSIGIRDVAANGQPVNQEDLLGTILAFSVVAYRSMRRLGVRISLADVPVADNFYTWLVVGDLLGVDPSVLQQLDLGLAEELKLAIRDDQYGCSEEGTRLAAHLLATLEDQMPIFFRKLPRTLIWHCTRPERVPQILGLPRPAWWGFVLRWVDVEAEGPLSRLSSWLTRAVTAKVGRLMFIGFIDANVDGDGRRWDVPEKMVAQLRLRSGRVARFTRRARRATRRKMRLAVPNRPVDSRRLDARLERQRR